MAVYTELTHSQIEGILRLYQLSAPSNTLSMNHGISNSNYRVTVEDKDYLLKVSNDKTQEQLEQEFEILGQLARWQFPYVLLPMSLPSGDLVYQLDQFHGVLFPFIEGMIPEITQDSCEKIGSALAKLHRLGEKDLPSSIRSFKDVSYSPLQIFEYITKAPQCPEDFKEACHLLITQEQAHQFEQLPQGIIHGDLYYDNTLFKDGELHFMLDFEQAGVGPLLLDLGISISGSCLEGELLDQTLIENYMLGYQKVRSLQETELELLSNAIIWGFLSIALWRIKRFKEGNLDPSKADNYRQLLFRAKKYAQSLR